MSAPKDIREAWFALVHSVSLCFRCGNPRVQAHHEISCRYRVAWMPQNGIPLCQDCHDYAHSHKEAWLDELVRLDPAASMWIRKNKNKTVSWDKVRAALQEASR